MLFAQVWKPYHELMERVNVFKEQLFPFFNDEEVLTLV
jgi:hypothetical protein